MNHGYMMNAHDAETQKVLSSGGWIPEVHVQRNVARGLRNDLIDRISRAAMDGLLAVERMHVETALGEWGVNLDEAGHHLEAVLALCQKAREA